VYLVRLDGFPHPACLGGDLPLAVAGLPVALARTLARLEILAEADRPDLVVRQQLPHHAPDAGHGDLLAGPARGLPYLLDAPGEAGAHALDRRPHLRRLRRASQRRLTAPRAIREAFLVPKEHLRHAAAGRRQMPDRQTLIGMKRMSRVSAAMLLMRLRQAAVIDRAALSKAFRTLTRDWRTNEPAPLRCANGQEICEMPRRFERLCYRALR